MKKATKRFLAVLLALAMVMCMAVPAFADDETYSITINNPASGETYTAYKIFDAVKGTKAEGQEKDPVSYTISTSSPWYSTVSTYATEANGMTLTASAADPTKMVVTTTSSFSAANFAAALNTALHPATGETTITDTGTLGTTNGTSVTIDVSSKGAGYYFVDTSLGSLCSLDTVTGTQKTIYEKNTVPSITKKVAEDGNDTTSWKDSTDVDICDDVKYQLTVNTGTKATGIPTDSSDKTGAEGDYTVTDTLPTGMSLKGATTESHGGEFKVYVTSDSDWTEDTDYTVSVSGQVVTITLKESKVSGLTANTNIKIEYTAVLSNTSTVGATGNTNEATVKYKGHTSTEADATVKTYEIGKNGDAVKFKKVKENEDGDALGGVTFQLSKTGSDNKTYYAKADSNGYFTGWTETQNEAYSITTGEDGSFSLKGLDAGTYILTETATVDGYNLLDDTITVEIANDTVKYKLTKSEGAAAETINVVNKAGTELPSTGGMGTTIFYIVGGAMTAGALVLLITKKRMNGYED